MISTRQVVCPLWLVGRDRPASIVTDAAVSMGRAKKEHELLGCIQIVPAGFGDQAPPPVC